MSKRSIREHLSSSSSDTSPNYKLIKMSESEHVEEEQGVPTLSMIYSVLKEMQVNIKSIMEENATLKAEHKKLKESVAVLLQENEEIKQTNIEQEEHLENLRLKVKDIEVLQDDLNQYQRKYNLELHGIPEKDDEDLDSIVEELVKVLHIDDIDESDIDIVHRLPSKLKPRPVIVKFKSYQDKKNIYEARWKLKKFQNDSGEKLNGAKKIYINENLTSQRRQLFSEVRKRAKQNGWYSVFTIDGKIFIKTEKGGRNRKITKQADLEDYFF